MFAFFLVLSEVTLSALNAPDMDVDIMGLGDQGSVKKLDFDSGWYYMHGS